MARAMIQDGIYTTKAVEGFMTTINPDKPILPLAEKQRASKTAASQKSGFDAVFKEVAGTPAQASGGVAPGLFPAEVRPGRFANDHSAERHETADNLQRLVDTLAAYQEKLGENGVTLKEMHELVRQMRSQSEALGGMQAALYADPKLKAIADHSLMLATMEVARYYNGDYTD